MKDLKDYIEKNNKIIINELFDLLKLKSISADPKYKNQVLKTAELISKILSQAGAENIEICPTPGYPIIYADKIIDKKLPTVLVYGHYDVQPPDPLNLWDSDPFDPVIKKTKLHPNGAIFARGACDDKGQLFMQLKAFEYMLKTNNLPCNVKFMIEGEEEVGSNSLEEFVFNNKSKLKADKILISDTGILSNDIPTVTIGLRGLSYVEVEVTGPNRDLHSGIYGGAVANPINILSNMISSLHDENKKIKIPGFYDDVIELSDTERKEIIKIPFDINEYKSHLDIEELEGESGFTTLERNSVRPTLDVNGIWGGYTGEGAKTVIPSKAYAKISMRLVPNQDHKKITQIFSNYFKSIAPKSVKVNVKEHHGGMPYISPTDDKGYIAASLAIKKTFGIDPIPLRTGGSIPIVALFEKQLNIKSILLGFGLDSDAIHSPNEHFGLFNFFKGLETIPWFFKYYTDLMKNK